MAAEAARFRPRRLAFVSVRAVDIGPTR